MQKMSRRPRRALMRMLTGLLVLGMGSAGVVVTSTSASAAWPQCNAVQNYLSGRYVTRMPSYSNVGAEPWACYLKYGSNDHGRGAVAMLQSTMNICYGRNLVVDGSFGKATEKALRYVQEVEKIKVDGSFGSETRWSMKWPVYIDGDSYAGYCWERW